MCHFPEVFIRGGVTRRTFPNSSFQPGHYYPLLPTGEKLNASAQRSVTGPAAMTARGMQAPGTVVADADQAGEAQRPQVEPQPQRKQRRRRMSHNLQFKLKLVKLALARPPGHRIKPVCREFPQVEPVTPTPPRSCPLAPVSALQSLLESCSRAMSPPTRFSCVNGFERSRSRRGSRWGSATRRSLRHQRCRSRSPCRVCQSRCLPLSGITIRPHICSMA